eukprot:10628905-Karenia_brevis.AAC.1
MAKVVGSIGLKLHWGKTKALCNTPDQARYGPTHLTVGGEDVELLKYGDSVSYLGRSLCLSDIHDEELSSRMRKAWAKFGSLKSTLCCRHYPLRDRM